MELMIAKHFESLKPARAGNFTTVGECSQGLELVQKPLSKNEANKKRGDSLSRKASFSEVQNNSQQSKTTPESSTPQKIESFINKGYKYEGIRNALSPQG